MAQMKKQYSVEIQFPEDQEKGIWRRGSFFDPCTNPHQRFYDSLSEAEVALERLQQKFNKKHTYGPDGKRREASAIGGGFAADMILDKKIDDMNRIVAWRIAEREVTPWKLVSSSD